MLTTLNLDDNGLDEGLLTEIDRLLAVNTTLDSKFLSVMMSTHARLGAGSDLRVLDASLITMICDVFCRESSASSLLDEGDVEEEEASGSGSELESGSGSEPEEEEGEDADGWGKEEKEEEEEAKNVLKHLRLVVGDADSAGRARAPAASVDRVGGISGPGSVHSLV